MKITAVESLRIESGRLMAAAMAVCFVSLAAVRRHIDRSGG